MNEYTNVKDYSELKRSAEDRKTQQEESRCNENLIRINNRNYIVHVRIGVNL